MSDLWVLSGESGLNEHWVERIFDHEPTEAEVDAIDRALFPREMVHYDDRSYEVSGGQPGGWAGWRVTHMRQAGANEWREKAT